MIQRDDILSMEYLKKTEFTGCHKGMRYRLERADGKDGEKKLKCTVWPEPLISLKHPKTKKRANCFFLERMVSWMQLHG